MSWSKSVTIWCDADGCNEWHDGEGSSTIGAVETASRARRLGRNYGWAYRNGRDLCPEHADVEIRRQQP